MSQNTPVKTQSKACRKGHERTPENTRTDARGYPTCLICRRAKDAETRKQFVKPKGFRHYVYSGRNK